MAAVPVRVASIWRTLASWALMLSRRWLAALSSRSESVRTRSAVAFASLTIRAASWRASSRSRPPSRVASARV